MNLLEDKEDQVRAMAASHISEITKKLSIEFVTSDGFIEKLMKLSKDPIVNVRSSFASSVTQIAKQIAKTNQKEKYLEIIKGCLNDNNTEVQLNIITTLEHLKIKEGEETQIPIPIHIKTQPSTSKEFIVQFKAAVFDKVVSLGSVEK